MEHKGRRHQVTELNAGPLHKKWYLQSQDEGWKVGILTEALGGKLN